MMSASEGGGGHGKADAESKAVSKSIPNGDKGEGVKKIRKFCGHHIWKLPKDRHADCDMDQKRKKNKSRSRNRREEPPSKK